MSFKFSNSGVTLIEILVAVSILIAFLLPVYGLYMMNSRQQDYVRAWGNALDISSDVMERLLSDDVPFLAIEPEGFGSGTKAAAANGRLQADFSEEEQYKRLNLKSILGAAKNGDYRLDNEGDRIITRGGIDFKVLVWAGIYEPDEDSPSQKSSYKFNADPTRELTFSYYPNPWFDPHNDCAESNTANPQASLSAELTSVDSDSSCAKSAGRPINPYRQVSGGVDGTLFYYNAVKDPMDDSFRHGFPVVGEKDWAGQGQAAVENARASEWDEIKAPDKPNEIPIDSPYNPRYEDKEFHNFEDLDGDGKDDGALMKLIVGVKWIPRGWKLAEAAKNNPELAQEYYLVSFKANLLSKIE